MRILIVGNGGREHAFLWKLRADAPQAEFFVTRPNGGMAGACEAVEIAPTDIEALAGWAAGHRVDLTVVGPEAPLAAGIVDRFRAKGLSIFGPTAAASRIEASKVFAKDLMRGAGVPTAGYKTFSNRSAAEAWVKEQGAPIVVKASGLAAGKGAVVCGTVPEALDAIGSMIGDLAFGEAGREVVIEEYVDAEELSIFAVTDGVDIVTLAPAQDHKRVGEGDTGPNTGGMGAYAPLSIADAATLDEARERIFAPTLRALAKEGAPFQGILYAGLWKTAEGLKVVEFNCRLGDPEAQVVLPLMSSSLLELMRAVAEGGSLRGGEAGVVDGAAVTTVVASAGYPGSYEKGKAITLPSDLDADTIVFHAGTAVDDGRLVTAGGRVVAVTAVRPTLDQAVEASRRTAAEVRFEGAFHRADIGWRELERTAPPTT